MGVAETCRELLSSVHATEPCTDEVAPIQRMLCRCRGYPFWTTAQLLWMQLVVWLVFVEPTKPLHFDEAIASDGNRGVRHFVATWTLQALGQVKPCLRKVRCRNIACSWSMVPIEGCGVANNHRNKLLLHEVCATRAFILTRFGAFSFHSGSGRCELQCIHSRCVRCGRGLHFQTNAFAVQLGALKFVQRSIAGKK